MEIDVEKLRKGTYVGRRDYW